MSAANPLHVQWGALSAALSTAYESGDLDRFLEVLDRLGDARERALSRDLQKLTESLRRSLEEFCVDSRLADLAGREMPDARLRLDHALKLTEEAAHTTMDLVERSGPLAERTAKQAAALAVPWRDVRPGAGNAEELQTLFARIGAFLTAAQLDSEVVRANLADVLMAQGYQDLSGQIIRNVIKLVSELERALTRFADLSGGSARGTAAVAAPVPNDGRGFGPAVPGVSVGIVGEQQDVDALIAELGM